MKKKEEALALQQRIKEARENPTTQSKSVIELQAINNRLSAVNMHINKIRSDGDCLFNAVLDQLQHIGRNDLNDQHELRVLTSDYMMQHPNDFAPFLYDEHNDLEEYCNKMRDTHCWGGNLELQALSKVLQVNITIYAQDNVVEFEEENYQNTIHLSFHKHQYVLGEHYNSVLPNS
eukprot:TRINITY_DN252_c0_g1_i1.p1 TRINITY_DN252_c0_g1~~TRINITY_DN252_c0_g1_i1.p1  ORF type:complete len:176 (-),score=33.84 TRINITY_DN252_c0_g1_i1:25-552(-)